MDRFGDIPAAAENLLHVALLKAEAHEAKITQIVQKPNGIRIYMHRSAELDSRKVTKMLEEYQGKLKYISEEEPYFFYRMQKKEQESSVWTMHYPANVAVAAKSKTALAEELFQIVEDVIQKIGG